MVFRDNKYVWNVLKEPKITTENEVEMDKKEEKDKISVETVQNVVNKSLELFDCSSLKNVKPDRTFK